MGSKLEIHVPFHAAMSLPPGLTHYEFQRVLAPSRDLPHYYHLRLLKDAQGLPALTPDNLPHPTPIDIQEFFGVAAPLEIEVGCGKGTFLLAYCDRHPEIPFLALEKEAEFAYRAAGRLVKHPGIHHARVVLGEASPFFRDFLPDACASAVHIYFPDPWPKKRHHKHRLMQEDFLEQVRRVSLPGAQLFFGTDHEEYNRETQELFARTSWL
jgi:tRNA (guanine-N7-)-methyltransferase